jgi:endonuclease/exonuclease/phosphatase family metal-dependent hydrolase
MLKRLIYISLIALTFFTGCSKEPWGSYIIPKDLLDEKERTDTTIIKVVSIGTIHTNAALPRFAEIIDSLDADFVLAREVDHDNTRSGKGVKQGERIAVLAGMHHYFGGSQVYNGGFYGLSLLSKYEIIDSSKVMFTGSRPVAAITVKYPNGKDFVFVGAQFTDASTPAAAATRIQHASLLLNITKNYLGPTVLAGNFWIENPYEDPTMDILYEQFDPGCLSCEFTQFPVNAPFVVADHIMYKKSRRYEVRVKKYEVLPKSPTDRLVVYSELEIIQ